MIDMRPSFCSRILFPSAVLLAACGNGGSHADGTTTGGPGGAGGAAGLTPPEVTGTIAGETFDAKDDIAVVGSYEGGTAAGVLIADQPHLCADAADGGNLPNDAQMLVVALAVYDAATMKFSAPTAPGTFEVVTSGTTPENGSNAADVLYDGANSYESTSGTVTLTSVTPGGTFAGSGDVTLSSGDHITFTFDAPACAAASMFGSP